MAVGVSAALLWLHRDPGRRASVSAVLGAADAMADRRGCRRGAVRQSTALGALTRARARRSRREAFLGRRPGRNRGPPGAARGWDRGGGEGRAGAVLVEGSRGRGGGCGSRGGDASRAQAGGAVGAGCCWRGARARVVERALLGAGARRTRGVGRASRRPSGCAVGGVRLRARDGNGAARGLHSRPPIAGRDAARHPSALACSRCVSWAPSCPFR